MKSRILILSLALAFGSMIMLSMTSGPQKAKWAVPDKYAKMKNPVKADAASVDAGKALWNKHCKSCHGAKGLGDGAKAAGLKNEPGNFTSKEFQGQSDGAIYYKAIIGRDEMPNYEKKITAENDRWALVNFMRTLK